MTEGGGGGLLDFFEEDNDAGARYGKNPNLASTAASYPQELAEEVHIQRFGDEGTAIVISNRLLPIAAASSACPRGQSVSG
ncbi:hypothetical protein E2562_001626 [Oryza meyeriana var. granulata]|uniref:Uncharacterized protein n=1 Tax=Oryza meyeriana var. granulata TaxID=110450 RepID=A0A6G1CD00_9ORYZ|nr:hypothetical protein E2562_001626 [Oryza meyeriana var. granulata]